MFFLYMVITVVIMSALMVFLTRMTLKVMGKLGGETFQRIHESAEFISNTRKVPPFWTVKVEKQINKLKSGNAGQDKIRRAEIKAKNRCMRQMKKLLKFAANTSTVADEETRDILIKTFTSTMAEWKEMTWSEMTGTG
jgi:hypothetical protein